jgi:hypothetical protein
MKTTKMYEIREAGQSLSAKLRTYKAARKLVSRLNKRGRDAYLAAMNINLPKPATRPVTVVGRTDIAWFSVAA